MVLTKHCQKRLNQRGITKEKSELNLTFGVCEDGVLVLGEETATVTDYRELRIGGLKC
jgi:hypothetical protein